MIGSKKMVIGAVAAGLLTAGHVRWNQHRCEGGRFDDFHVR